MRTARYFNSLNKKAKKLAMIYFSNSLKVRVKADNANDMFRKLEAIQEKNPSLPDLPNIDSKFWHQKLRGRSIDGVTMEKLEAYIPNITKPLRHPLWKLLSRYTLSDIEIHELVDDLDSNISKYLFIQNGIKTNNINITSYRELHIIARHINLDALAALLIVIHKKMRDGNYEMLQALFIVSMDIIFALSIAQPFEQVAHEIYNECHEKFYSKEFELLDPLTDPDFLTVPPFDTRSLFPKRYYPSVFFAPHNEALKYETDILKIIANEAVNLGYIEDKTNEKIKVAYYSFGIGHFESLEEEIKTIISKMSVDRRGRPGTR